jgi:hypothetical protein
MERTSDIQTDRHENITRSYRHFLLHSNLPDNQRSPYGCNFGLIKCIRHAICADSLYCFAVKFNFKNPVFIRTYPMVFIFSFWVSSDSIWRPPPLNVMTLFFGSSRWNCSLHKSGCVQHTVLSYSRAYRAFHNRFSVLVTELFCMIGRRPLVALGPASGAAYFNPYRTQKRQFSPLVGNEYSLNDARNLRGRLILRPWNLPGYPENFRGFPQFRNQTSE